MAINVCLLVLLVGKIPFIFLIEIKFLSEFRYYSPKHKSWPIFLSQEQKKALTKENCEINVILNEKLLKHAMFNGKIAKNVIFNVN